MTVGAEADLLRAYPTSALPPQIIARIEELATGSEPVSAFVYRPEVAATRATRLRAALPRWAEVFYAVKANSFPGVLRALAETVEGFDIASPREAELAAEAAAAAGKPARLVAAGPGKNVRTLKRLFDLNVELINVESMLEMQRVARLGREADRRQRVALRINPAPMTLCGTVDVGHAATPFGVDDVEAGSILDATAGLTGVDIVGFHFHVVCNNSNAEAHAAFVQWCLTRSIDLATTHGIDLRVVDVGGGLGVPDNGADLFDLETFANRLDELRPPTDTTVVLEPGRWLVDDCGYYAAEVVDVKRIREQWFAVLRGGVNHFMRPAAYARPHNFAVVPIDAWPEGLLRPLVAAASVTLVGELCTPADVLATDVNVDQLRAGDVAVFPRAGSYGWEMSLQTFLGHPPAARVVAEARPYDEALDENGRPRPTYEQIARQLGWDPLDPQTMVAAHLGERTFTDDTPVIAVPVVLDEDECRRLGAGVAQRTKALQQFFADIVLGDGSFLRAHSELTASLLDEILVSEGMPLEEIRQWWKGHDASAICFVHAPDLMRDPSGRWVVIEDNVGCVTGCVDGHLIAQAYNQATGLDEVSSTPDLAAVVERWLSRLGLPPTAPGVVAMMSDGAAAHCRDGIRFNEDDRRIELMQQIGVRVVEGAELDELCVLAKLKAMVNIGVPSSMEQMISLCEDVFGSQRVPFFNAPGTGLLGSKALLPFISDMAQHYIGEDLLLPSAPTRLARDGSFPADPENWVLKTAAGCQGTGVFILRSQTDESLIHLKSLLATSWPKQAAVAQQRIDASRLRTTGEVAVQYVVEVRAIAYALGWQDVVIGEHLIAKLAPQTTPETLNNISCGGTYAPVITVQSKVGNPMAGGSK